MVRATRSTSAGRPGRTHQGGDIGRLLASGLGTLSTAARIKDVAADGRCRCLVRRDQGDRGPAGQRPERTVYALTAGDLSQTTGLHIPVDSGVAAAFLR